MSANLYGGHRSSDAAWTAALSGPRPCVLLSRARPGDGLPAAFAGAPDQLI